MCSCYCACERAFTQRQASLICEPVIQTVDSGDALGRQRKFIPSSFRRHLNVAARRPSRYEFCASKTSHLRTSRARKRVKKSAFGKKITRASRLLRIPSSDIHPTHSLKKVLNPLSPPGAPIKLCNRFGEHLELRVCVSRENA